MPTEEGNKGEKVLRWLVGMAAAVVVIGGLHAAAGLVTRVLVIAFVAILLSPVYYFLVRRRVPARVAVALLVLAMAGVCAYGLGYAVPRAVLDFSKKLPAYHDQLVEAAGEAADWMQDNGIPVRDEDVTGMLLDKSELIRVGRRTASWTISVTGDLVLMLIIVGFLIADLPRLPRMRRLPFMTETRWRIVVGFVHDVRRYMGIKTLVSAATALCIWAGVRVAGIDPSASLLLALAAFLLNFVPAIGSVIAAVLGVALALSAGGPGTAVALAAWYVVVNQVLGNILEPRFMGSGFGVSPAVVMISVLFWGWVLGPVGMLFAVPLTMAVRGTLVSRRPSVQPPSAAAERA
ncbi:MAG: AI-2E family transporter [Kiritimatiellae bacterium]|nr:AI-2E family transporter [Kiritimatiellia bacterium]